MSGETNLLKLLQTMQPRLHEGDYVFCTVPSLAGFETAQLAGMFKEEEGFTVIIAKALADKRLLPYSFIAAWITLTVHSSLEAVGLTAAFSSALAAEGISCNTVAAFYHDHIFVNRKDADRAMNILSRFALQG